MDLPEPVLVDLSEAFNRIGATFCDGWEGDELVASRLGQRRNVNRATWDRAQNALRVMRELARDGRLGLILYDGNGARRRYFEHADWLELAHLYPSPVEGEPGMVELADGSHWVCEADISKLKLRGVPRQKPGPRPQFVRFLELCGEYFLAHGIGKLNADVQIYVRDRIDKAPWPRSQTTINKYIDEARCTARAQIQNSNSDLIVTGTL